MIPSRTTDKKKTSNEVNPYILCILTKPEKKHLIKSTVKKISNKCRTKYKGNEIANH